MSKVSCLIFLLLLECGALFAQTMITNKTNGFRQNDVIRKQQIEYKDPGRSGNHVLWEFSRLKRQNENYKISYNAPTIEKKDTFLINAIEHQTRYSYEIINDSLLQTGFENTGSTIKYNNPQLLLHYPFSVGDSISSSFQGEGVYMDVLHVETLGSTYSVADAIGTLVLPDEDTLENTIRVRTQQEYLQITYPIEYKEDNDQDLLYMIELDSLRKASSDTVIYRVVSWKWYAPGYRYPLFETMHNYSRLLRDTVEKNDIATAFYFPPSMHEYLNDDPINKSILDSLLVQKNVKDAPQPNQDDKYYDFNCYPNPVQNNLYIELLLERQSAVVIRIVDLAGNVEMTKQVGVCSAGLYTYPLDVSQLREGQHVLHLVVDDHIESTIIIKK